MNRFQEISRSLIRQRLREKLEQRRLGTAVRRALNKRQRSAKREQSQKLH